MPKISFYLTLIFLFTASLSEANQINIFCNINKSFEEFDAKTSFSKKIDLNNKIIVNQNGYNHDKIMHLNENEIIFQNKIHETYSVYGVHSGIWTIYYDRKILIYECKKKKR